MRIARSALPIGLVLLSAVMPALAETQNMPIKHVVIIMQENRSFDSYFGTFPGADGIPANTCVPLDPTMPAKGCVVPFHDARDVNAGGPHNASDASNDLDDGVTKARKDGFVVSQSNGGFTQLCHSNPGGSGCVGGTYGVLRHDVMGYHTDEDIPNYWAYAKSFVLQDKMFPGIRSWSLPSHLGLTSEWSAVCTDNTDATTCTTSTEPLKPGKSTTYPWVSLFQLLDAHRVSWKYYLGSGDEPDCEDGSMECEPQAQSGDVSSYWNPVPSFAFIKAKGKGFLANHVPPIEQFIDDVHAGNLPKVSWIVPAHDTSEHPPQGITAGMEYVTSLVNAIMASPYWSDTAIFIAWDDWGGFYDHVTPPNIDTGAGTAGPEVEGYGLRVPGLMVSAWAKSGMIDDSLYSFDAYATFIENLFAGGARLVPAALGNPDNRPDIRDALTKAQFLDGRVAPIGNLMNEFDFTQTPLPPLILSTHIPISIFARCSQDPATEICKSSNVHLTWSPVNGPQVPGPFTYEVQRDGLVLPACTGTATSCTDVPGSGTHYYRAISVDPNGVHSPGSAAAFAIQP